MLEGTFSVCSSKLLLFIIMGVDERGKGIPLAFMMLSVPSGNKQTSAGYNTEILTKLLRTWHSNLKKSGKRLLRSWLQSQIQTSKNMLHY